MLEPTSGRHRGALLLITTVELVVFLDATVVNIALPAIGRDLHLDEAGLSWVTNSYLLAFGGFLLVGGRMADLLGPRRMFAAGLAVFTLASAMAGVAPTIELLVAGRTLQGIGAAVVVPAQIALLATTFPEPRAYRRAFAVWSAMGSSGAAIGTAAGGLLTEGLGWPSIFLINVPVGIAGLVLIGHLLPSDGTNRARMSRLDLPGALVGTVALLLLGYGIGALGDHTVPTGLAAALVGCGLVLLLGFIAIEAMTRDPLMPLRLFRTRAVGVSTIVNVLVGAAHVPAFALLSLFLQDVLTYRPAQAAFAVLPVAVVGLVAGRTLIPVTLERIGAPRVLALGLGLQTVALAWFARLPDDATYLLDLLPGALVLGLGLPAAFVGATIPAVSAVGKTDTGVVAGILNTGQRIGAGLGVTALLLLASGVASAVEDAQTAAHATGLRTGFLAASTLAALGTLLTFVFLRRTQARSDDVPVIGARRTSST